MITMNDVAKKAGVSQATVSRVLSGNSSVNPEIRRKVMEWVRKLDYTPNIIAQSLVGSKSLLIGVIISDISNPFFADIIKAVESEAAKYGYSIILCNTDYNLEKEKKYISILKSYKVDGILIVPSNKKDKSFFCLKNSGIPLVVITYDIRGFSCISISHYMAGQVVAKHLINMGYSKFIALGPTEDDKMIGYKQQIESSGFNIDNDFVIINDENHNLANLNIKKFIINNLQSEGIGIFTYNDMRALVVLHILKEIKVKVPEKVALVGFDNTFISKEVSPTLSSVAQPIEEIGKQSVEILMNKIYKPENKQEKHIILEPRLVVRESSVKSIKY